MIGLHEFEYISPLTRALIERLHPFLQTAQTKETVEDLTDKEMCAICFFSGLPYEYDHISGRLTFHQCGLRRTEGKWHACMGPQS